MKTLTLKPTLIRLMAWTIFCAPLFAFTGETGLHQFSIYVNNDLVLQQYVSRQVSTGTITLPASPAAQLTVYYNHCGEWGTARRIVIRNEQNKVLKEWSFEDAAAGTNGAMVCNVKEIPEADRNSGGKLSLFYSCAEIPEGKLLTFVNTTKHTRQP